MFSYQYPRPGFTCDTVLFTFENNELKLLLIQRADDPFKDFWALPGGFVNEGENAEQAVKRELFEETGLSNIPLNQVFLASEPGRDPRGWTISLIFLGFVPIKKVILVPGDDAKNAGWFPSSQLPKLAFDHKFVIEKVLDGVLQNIIRHPFLPNIFDGNFSVEQLSEVYFQLVQNHELVEQSIRYLIQNEIIMPADVNGFYKKN